MRDELQPLVHEQIAQAEQRRADLAVFVGRLTAALAHLEALPARDGPCDPECGFQRERVHHQPHPVDLTPTPASVDTRTADSAPVACSLGADQYGTRMQDWRAMLDGAHREGLPDGGIRVRLPIARAGQLAGLVVAEQQCCPFLTFRLTLAGDHVELDAYAPDGAEALVASLFGEQTAPC